MARQIIDIGIQGNDGTGDSIRESFRKVNDNFTQLFAVFGQGDRIAFADLDDTPENFPNGLPRGEEGSDADKLIVINETADALIGKNLVGGAGIAVDHSNPEQILITATQTEVVSDASPTLGGPLDANGKIIAKAAQPNNLDAIAEFNNIHEATITPDDVLISKSYADKFYLQTSGATGIGTQVRIRQEPTGVDQYFYNIESWEAGYARVTGHGFNTGINGAKFVYIQSGNQPATGLNSSPLINTLTNEPFNTYYIRYQSDNLLGIYPTRQGALDDPENDPENSRIVVNGTPSVAKDITTVDVDTISGNSILSTFTKSNLMTYYRNTGLASGIRVDVSKTTNAASYNKNNTNITIVEIDTNENYEPGAELYIRGSDLDGDDGTGPGQEDLLFNLITFFRGSEQLVDAYYTPIDKDGYELDGNWLNNEALPRLSTVRRQGDHMSGPLYLNDHPGAFGGLNIGQSDDDLQAATRFYVDNSSFASNINLFVATTGRNDQSIYPEDKQGRSFAFAFANVGPACKRAEELIELSLTEPGPYRQTLTYGNQLFKATLDNTEITGIPDRIRLQINSDAAGIDQTKNTENRDLREGSIIKGLKSGATGKVITYDGVNGSRSQYTINLLHKKTDITNFQTNYVDAAERLKQNKNFIAEQTLAFVDLKYTNLVYSRSKCLRDSKLILDAIINDVEFGGNKQTIIAAKKYWNGNLSVVPETDQDPDPGNVLSQKNSTEDAIDYLFRLVEVILETNTVIDNFISGVDDIDIIAKRNLTPILGETTNAGQITGLPNAELGSTDIIRYLSNSLKFIVRNGITANPGKLEFIPTKNGIIKSVSINNQGLGYLPASGIKTYYGIPLSNNIIGSSGNGINVTANITIENGKLVNVDIVNKGQNYEINDKFTIDSSDLDLIGNPTITTDFILNVDQVQILEGEELEFGQPVPELQITIRVESGIYYEQLPIRIPPNVSIKGDEFRRVIIRPAPGESASPWADIYFRRDDEFDGLSRSYYSDPGAVGAVGSTTVVVNSTVGLDIGMHLKIISGTGQFNQRAQVVSLNEDGQTFTISLPIVSTLGNNAVVRGLNNTNLSRKQIPGNVLDTNYNYGRHYLIDPDNISSPRKENKFMDVFLLNDATIIRNVTCQSHGGFMCVLDPIGQIQTKSPYFQTNTSLSGSINAQRYAGGILIDGFCGNLPATITSITNATTLNLSNLNVRLPNVPNSFYINGERYQINAFESYNDSLGTAIAILDENTPYSGLSNIPIIIETAGNRSMLANDFTQVNDLGYGAVATNNGITELVSVFSYYCWTSYYADKGGQIRSVAGNSSYGQYGLRAEGRDPNELPDDVVLLNNTVQVAKIYKQGELIEENKKDSQIVYINNYDYIPFNVSEIEIDHSVNRSRLIRNTASITNAVTIVNGGSGYSVGQILDVIGGTPVSVDTTAQIEVIAAPGGIITAFIVSREGEYIVNPLGNNDEGVFSVTGGAQFRGTFRGEIVRYEISSASLAGIDSGAGGQVLRLILNSESNSGLLTDLNHEQNITIRLIENIKFGDVANRTPVRPSTALKFKDSSENINNTLVYRTLNYVITNPDGTELPAGQAILNLESGYDYVILSTDASKIVSGKGKNIGDTQIAILAVDPTIIARINSQKLIFGWNGVLYKILSYSTDINGPFVNIEQLTSPGNGLLTGIPSCYIVSLRGGVQAGELAEITINISTCRATGHDMLDVGTGGFNDSNYPNNLLGKPVNSPNQINEIVETTEGRVFYVTTDQSGFFRVGKFFSVDQGSGTVKFSASIALSRLDGLGFKEGVEIRSFDPDSRFDVATHQAVPTKRAVRDYIDRRLGITHDDPNAILSDSEREGPGFLPLSGNQPMRADLSMEGIPIGGSTAIRHNITGLASPRTGATGFYDATNKLYVDNGLAAQDEFKELKDVYNFLPQQGDFVVFTSSNETLSNGKIGGDLNSSFNYVYKNVTAQLSNPLGNSDSDVSAGIQIANIQNGPIPDSGSGLDYFQIDDEIFSYQTYAANTLSSVVRAVLGTTKDTHTANSVVRFLDKTEINLQINPDTIINEDIKSDAAIDQTKLALTLANTTAASPSETLINAGSFVIGKRYRIVSQGTINLTDFTIIGSLNNNVGTIFQATGIGSGEGTAVDFDALQATAGLSSFDSANFEITNGWVGIKNGGVSNIELVNSTTTLGNTTLTLGSTTTALSGLTSIDATIDTTDFFNTPDSSKLLTNARFINLGKTGNAKENLTGTITSTSLTTTITSTNTSGLLPGMLLVEQGNNTGSFGIKAVITSINSPTELTFTAETANTAGAITFNVVGLLLIQNDNVSIKGYTDFDSNINIDGNNLTTNQLSFDLLNTNATTVNAFGAATTINIGAAGNIGTLTIKNDNVDIDGATNIDSSLSVQGDLTVNGGNITSSSTEVNLFQSTATTINFGLEATSINIGNRAGDTTIRGNLIVNGTTTTINSNTLTVDDKNIELGSVVAVSGLTGTIMSAEATTTITGTNTAGLIPGMALTESGTNTGSFGTNARITSIDNATQLTFTAESANTAGAITFDAGGTTNFTADGGGITLKGDTDKTITWINSTGFWTSNQTFAAPSFLVNGASIVFEGATANDHQTTLTITDPDEDRTITFPNNTGTVAVAVSNTTSSTQGELNLTFTLSNTGVISASGTTTGLSDTGTPTFAGLTINGASIVFEGATANDHQTTLTITDPTEDRTITFPDNSGTVALLSDVQGVIVNDGTLSAGTITAGLTNTTVDLNFSTNFSANSATNVTINTVVGPALTNLATTMHDEEGSPTTGFLTKTGENTYTLDTNTYLTAAITSITGGGGISATTNGGAVTLGSTATSENTVSAIVARDSSGDFSARYISFSRIIANGTPIPGETIGTGTVSGKWTLDAGSEWNTTLADLAEWYQSDQEYEPGTLLIFGGIEEVTISTTANNTRVAGVVSTAPGFIMSADLPGPSACIALQGKVPVKVIGQVQKGDLLVSSDTPGYAIVNNSPVPYTVIGKALENKITNDAGVIMVSVGR